MLPARCDENGAVRAIYSQCDEKGSVRGRSQIMLRVTFEILTIPCFDLNVRTFTLRALMPYHPARSKNVTRNIIYE